MRRKILFPLLFSVATLILSITVTHADEQPKVERKAKKSKSKSQFCSTRVEAWKV